MNPSIIYNVSYFKIIDTIEKAYWLGVCYAKGYVNHKNGSSQVILPLQDEGHLILLRDTLRTLVGITYKDIRSKEFAKCILRINHSQFRESLITMGCVPNISERVQPNKVPKSLFNHFIRGYYDANGFINEYMPGVIIRSSSRVILQWIRAWTDCTGIVEEIRPGYYEWTSPGLSNIVKFHKYIYQDATIHLTRKKLV